MNWPHTNESNYITSKSKIQTIQRATLNKLVQMAQKTAGKHVPKGQLTLLKF